MGKSDLIEKRGTELVFILDRSASMEGLEQDTINGFRSMIKRKKKQKGAVKVTTVLFDDVCEELYFRQKIKEVPEMTKKEYFVGGCTALLDAVGKIIHKMLRVEKERKKEVQVIFVIITDGFENSSKEYTYDSVKKLIEKQKNAGWEFLFLGANMDAVREAENFGISSDKSVTFHNDSLGVALNYEVLGETITAMRMEESGMHFLDDSWKAAIEKDYKNRR